MTVSSTYANAATAAVTTAGGSKAASAVSASNTLTQLAGNFTDFLSLLTTQLKNQDPTSPMDTNAFTSQLVQFTSVAEQISTNTTLGSLLTSSLSQQLSQASNLVGQQVTFSGTTLPLQSGSATLQFTAATAGPVTIAVSDANGNAVHTETVNASAGSSNWTWNGVSDSGAQKPDGGYTVAVTSNGTTVPFTATGTVTGAEQVNQAVQLQFGRSAVPFSSVVSLNGTNAGKT
jgi:flagellar basal-body rod modification protein FlgD